MISRIYIRKAIFTACILIALISVGAAITAVSALEKYTRLEGAVQSFQASSAIHSEEIYYIKEHGEIIGVFDGKVELLYTVEVYVKTLPATDRTLLKKGIAARDREELYEILGDYDA